MPVPLTRRRWRAAAGVAAGSARAASTALGRPALRMLLLSYFGYSLARKASRVALVVLAFTLGGVEAVAAISIAQLLPAAVIGPLGSSIGDRLDPARALGIGYAAQALGLLVTGAAVSAGAPLPAIAACAAVTNAAFALTRPVHVATLPDVAEHPDELPLGNAASVWVDGVASLVGPLLAGLGLALAGAGEVLLVLASVCLAASLTASRVVVRRIIRTSPEQGVRDVLLGGMRELARDRDGARLTGLLALQYAVVGLLDVLLVVVAVDVLGGSAVDTSVLAAAIGAGAALGAAGSLALAGRPRLRGPLLVGAGVTGAPIALLGVAPALGIALVLLTAYGTGKSLVTVSGQTLLQRTVPDEVSARVFGVQEGLIQAATAGGAALGPALVLGLGPGGALLVSGAILPTATLLIAGSLRRLDSRAVVPGPVFDLLRGIPFLAVLPPRTLEQLARHAERRVLPGGAVVFHQGEPGDRYYVVAAGRARVDVDGRPVRTLGPGEGFGEIALLERTHRTATVVAEDELTVHSLDREDFLRGLMDSASALEGARGEASARLRGDRDGAAHPDTDG